MASEKDDYQIAESKTWEVLRSIKDKSNYVRRLVRYRLWRAGPDDRDWRIQVEEDEEIKTFYLPLEVADIIRRESTKRDLKDDGREREKNI